MSFILHNQFTKFKQKIRSQIWLFFFFYVPTLAILGNRQQTGTDLNFGYARFHHIETKTTYTHVYFWTVSENCITRRKPMQAPRSNVAGLFPSLPESEICCCPCLVEVTTTAAMSLTCREACCSVYSFLLFRSAFTCKDGTNEMTLKLSKSGDARRPTKSSPHLWGGD